MENCENQPEIPGVTTQEYQEEILGVKTPEQEEAITETEISEEEDKNTEITGVDQNTEYTGVNENNAMPGNRPYPTPTNDKNTPKVETVDESDIEKIIRK